MDLVFRRATPDDLDRLLAIHVAAFPDPRPSEERRRNFVANPFGGLDALVVAEQGGVVVAHAFSFSHGVSFGGRDVPTGCIASVGVAPEARGMGVARALVRHLHRAADARGDALTMLYAFRQGFYARLGYAGSTPRRRLAIDPRAVPYAFCMQSRGRARAPTPADRDAIVRAYVRASRRTSGWLARPEALWDRIFARERRHVIVLDGAEGELAAYVAFELVQAEAHAATRLIVDELVADDAAARRALLGCLGAMRDQVAAIEIEVALDDPIDHALVDADGRDFGDAEIEHRLGVVVGGPMVRVEDVPRAVEARGYQGSAAFDLVMADADDEIAVSVAIDDGVARVSAARGAASALRTTRPGLSAILYGGLAPSAAAGLGLVDADPRLLARLDPVLALPPLLPLDLF